MPIACHLADTLKIKCSCRAEVDPVTVINSFVPSSLVSKSRYLSAFASGTVLALILCSLFCSVSRVSSFVTLTPFEGILLLQ
ncbi:hypothetical protein VNO80_01280 [Phaseolus coccineus]|uniref:Uncharacterized protein n=1 Tax=Phaseolus coccineus TaxID=3886 RepID=A0AAN9RSM1_PHACN